MRSNLTWLTLALATLAAIPGCSTSKAEADREIFDQELLNVSYDPTRELWKDLNAAFIPKYEADTGKHLEIKQSHAGSASQARTVIDGLEADVVTLAMWTDTNAIAKAGLIKDDWASALAQRRAALLVDDRVRRSQGQSQADQGLARPGARGRADHHAHPKTSGNGKLSFLAAWGSVIAARRIRRGCHATSSPSSTSTCRCSTRRPAAPRSTFAQKKIGDVHLTWENEAHFEVTESKGDAGDRLSRRSASAPSRAWPWSTRTSIAEEPAMRPRPICSSCTRPRRRKSSPRTSTGPRSRKCCASTAKHFQRVELFTIQQIAGGWEEADEKFFADGGVFDQIYSTPARNKPSAQPSARGRLP